MQVWIIQLEAEKILVCLPHLLIKRAQQHFRNLTVENLIITDLWVPHEELGGTHKSSPGGSVVKNPPANSGDSREVGLIPGSTKIPGSRKRQLTPVSSLENSMGWGAWWATVHGATKSQTRLSNWAHTNDSSRLWNTQSVGLGRSCRQSVSRYHCFWLFGTTCETDSERSDRWRAND